MKTNRPEWGQPSSTFPQEKELTERERIICVVRTKLAYALADVANSLLIDCEHTYNRVALGLKPAEKSRFKYLQQQAMRLKYAAKDATKTMYDLDMDAYYDDSDRLQEFLLLLVDRTAADEGRFEMCRRSLERMKSILGLYPKPQKKKEGLGRLLRD